MSKISNWTPPRTPEYYRISNESLSEVVERYVEYGDKLRDSWIQGWFDVNELWPVREYTWTRETSRAGYVPDGNGGYRDVSGPEKWDWLVSDMKENGWNKKEQPVMVIIDQEGKVKVGEGNHRLAIAKQIGMRKVPVRFMFYRSLSGGHQIYTKKSSRMELRIAFRKWVETF